MFFWPKNSFCGSSKVKHLNTGGLQVAWEIQMGSTTTSITCLFILLFDVHLFWGIGDDLEKAVES